MTKACSRCKVEKDWSEFYILKKTQKPKSRCKLCEKTYHKEHGTKATMRWRQKHPEVHQAGQKRYEEANADKIRTRQRNHYHTNHERITKARKDRAVGHEEETRKYYRLYARERRKDPLYRIKTNLRARVGKAVRGLDKSATTEELLGCTFEQLRAHLQSLFKPGMTWENMGRNGWHVDHKTPCCAFDLSDPEQQRVCFHFSNLQPLWQLDNLKKVTQDMEIARAMRNRAQTPMATL